MKLTRAQRSAAMRRYWACLDPEARRRRSANFIAACHAAGRANAICNKFDVLERYVHLDRDEAIWQAWRDSRTMARGQRYRSRQRAS